MKRYYFVLAFIFSLAVVVGVCSRQPNIASVPQATPTQQRAPKILATQMPTKTPDLVAIPLGTFTPTNTVQVYEYPSVVSDQAGVLVAQEPTAYTSEYRTQGELWACVMWEVDQVKKSWNCTGWALAEKDGEQFGTIERSWSPPERKQEPPRTPALV